MYTTKNIRWLNIILNIFYKIKFILVAKSVVKTLHIKECLATKNIRWLNIILNKFDKKIILVAKSVAKTLHIK